MQRLILAGALLASTTARADHDMAHMAVTAGADEPASAFAATVSFVAASYQQPFFGGDYEGVVPALSWTRGRWSAGASVGLYRIFENGVTQYGPGDVYVHGSIALVTAGELSAGLAVVVTAPTGNMYQGFGMGGPMLMPNAWAAWTHRRVTLSGSTGWGGMLAGGMGDHMMMSVVDPMNESELEWSAAVDVALGAGVRGGVRGQGGVPVGEPGVDRVIGAVRLAWTRGRVDTGAEVQAGLAGDPFRVRGVVETALHF